MFWFASICVYVVVAIMYIGEVAKAFDRPKQADFGVAILWPLFVIRAVLVAIALGFKQLFSKD